MFKQTMRSTANMIVRNPTQTMGGFVFVLGFSLISANALFSQSGNHPGPIWMTRDSMVVKAIRSTNVIGPKAHSVLTQRISMRNIPIPMLKPKKSIHDTSTPKLLKNYDGSSPVLAAIQKELTSAGFYSGEIDGIYGKESRAAIMKYQASRNLEQTGEPDSKLLASFEKKQKTHVPTSTHDAQMVKLIQTGLIEYGSEDITIDGIYGDKTKNAIRDFQARYKLSVDGEPSRAVLEKLTSIGAIKKS